MMENSTDNIVKSLQKFYLDKKYQDGIDYLLQHKKDLQPETFHYYFGTFQIKKGDLAVGKYHLKKSLQLGHAQDDVLHNIKVVDQQLSLNSIVSSYSWKDSILFTASSVSLDMVITFVLFFIFTTLLCYWRGVIQKSRWLILWLGLSLSPLLLHYMIVSQYHFAVALNNSEVREGPSDLYDVAGQLPRGLTVLMGDTYNQKVFIRAPLKFAGWVDKSSLGVL